MPVCSDPAPTQVFVRWLLNGSFDFVVCSAFEEYAITKQAPGSHTGFLLTDVRGQHKSQGRDLKSLNSGRMEFWKSFFFGFLPELLC